MGIYKQKYNALGKLGFSLVPTANVITFKTGVANQAALPLSGNNQNDARIANDTGLLYVWSIPASSGLLTDWISQGDIIDLDWSAITNKPSSSVANIDDAVSKRHTQGTDQGLDTGGLNAVTAAQAKAGYTHSGVITGNPHQVNKTDVGLSNVDNKSEATIITDVKADTDVADALTKKHAHSNQTVLDQIQEALTTALKSSYDACVTFITNFALGTPATDDVLAWNGSQFVPKAPSVTGFKGIDLFFDDTVSGILGYYTLSNIPVGGIEILDSVVVNANTVFLEGYISGVLGGTQIDAGVWEFDIYRYISSGTAAGTTELIFEVYKRTSGGLETHLFTVTTGDVNDTSNTLQSITTVQPAFVINSTDRLVVAVYGHRIEANNRTITFTHNGTSHYSHIHTPLILRHNDLAGLQGGQSGQYNHLTNTELLNVQALPEDLKNVTLNIMLNAFRIAQIGSLTIFNMIKGFMDEFVDESGVDTVNSLNEFYSASGEFYRPSGSNYDTETKLLLHLNTDLTDSSQYTHSLSASGGAAVSASEVKFGSGALALDGSGDYISTPIDSDFQFGSGNYTIDCWIYVNSLASNMSICSWNQDGTNAVYFYITTDGKINYLTAVSNILKVQMFSPIGTITTGQWYHVAVVRNGNSYNIYVNGISVQSDTNTDAFYAYTGNLEIGTDINNRYLNGYIDEFRISKGIARWTSSFTPETDEYIGTPTNMTLYSNAQVATSVPTSARIVLFEEDVDAITLNTDLKVYVSRDNGTTYTLGTLADEGNYIPTARVLSALIDISSQPSGTNVKYKIVTDNLKICRLHGVGISWK